jgi:hypothetical protein
MTSNKGLPGARVERTAPVVITGKIDIKGTDSGAAWHASIDPRGVNRYAVRMAKAVNERKLAARRIAELTKQAMAALDRPLRPAARARRHGANVLMTPRQVAGLLKIDVDTVSLWSRIGVLKQDQPPQDDRRFRRADILTFLPRSGKRPRYRGPSADVSKNGTGPV